MNRREKTIHLMNGQSPAVSPADLPQTPMPQRITDSELLDAYSRAVISVVERVGPAVVGITVRKPGNECCQDHAGGGSGVFFSPEGYIVTNNHVVHGAEHLSITLSDGTKLSPDVVGKDPATDLAVLRIEARGTPYVRFGDSDLLKVGQTVIIIGNPFGLKSTVSTGVISALGRSLTSITGRLIENVVQHTAPLNPGNSGGPMVDSGGCIVGVNTALVQSAQGIGFAIPSSTTKWVVSQLLMYGKVSRGYVGITGGQVRIEQWFARRHRLPNSCAIQVDSVDPDGPAWSAGIREGDLLSAFNGEDLTNVDDFYRLLSQWPVGKPITFTVTRRNGVYEITVIPAEADF